MCVVDGWVWLIGGWVWIGLYVVCGWVVEIGWVYGVDGFFGDEDGVLVLKFWDVGVVVFDDLYGLLYGYVVYLVWYLGYGCLG